MAQNWIVWYWQSQKLFCCRKFCSLHKRYIILVPLNLKKRVVQEHISATEYIYCKSSYVSLMWALAWLFWLDFAKDQLRKNWPASKQLSKLCFVVAFSYYWRTKESIYQILDENKLNKKSLDCSWGMLSGKCLKIFTVRLCRDRFDHSLRHAFLLQPKLKAQL